MFKILLLMVITAMAFLAWSIPKRLEVGTAKPNGFARLPTNVDASQPSKEALAASVAVDAAPPGASPAS
ncbi:MAG: hypothetical protein H7125_13495 [Proteobacteria bacterium]|nr:hypothetical protein [Burkholderiales bacterium]